MINLKILVFCSSRADYSLIKWLLKVKNSNIKFSLIISSNQKNKKSLTENIKKDEIQIYKLINLSSGDSNLTRSNNISIIINNLAKIIKSNHFDYMLILGDRFEVFASAIAANNFLLPIIHLSGGLLSLGSQDEYYRHAITKLSSFHFTTSEMSKKRVIQMGEQPSRVFNYGSLGVEAVKKNKYLSKSQLEHSLGIKILNKCIIVTLHPETVTGHTAEISNLIDALKKIIGVTIIFTSPNFDPGYKNIISEIKKFIKLNKNFHYFNNLNDQEYLSLIKLSNIVLGNSSSGFYQAPILRVPTINIGDRQLGRETCESIISIKSNTKDIYNNCKLILDDKKEISFKNFPYGRGNTSKKILNRLKKLPKNKLKNFFDINF